MKNKINSIAKILMADLLRLSAYFAIGIIGSLAMCVLVSLPDIICNLFFV